MPSQPLLRFEGTLWRAVFLDADPLSPVPSAEGRFHHSGQPAIYGSLSPEGCAVAIRRYLRAEDPPRCVVPLRIRAARLADARGRAEASQVWQDIRDTGLPSPTWQISDAARALGAEGLFYSSRSRPDLTHLVLFAPSVILSAGAPQPFPTF